MCARVLVTGAAGTVGRAVVAALASGPEAVEIVAFDRDTRVARRRLWRFRHRARCLFGDITDPAALDAACDGVDAVLHLAAMIPPRADAAPELARRVNLGGTEALIAALNARAPGAFLVFASSIAVYGDRLADPEIRVSDPLRAVPHDAYAQTKIAAEAAVRASGLDWTIFRLTAVMGGHALSPLMFHMPLDTPMEIITVRDAARAFARAPGARADLRGKVFNLSGGAGCRTDYRSFLARSFREAGLGAFDLPEAAFATRNFHCGWLADGDDLEAILHFRHDDLDAYFARQAATRRCGQKMLAIFLRRRIKASLLDASEPLQALRHHDAARCAQFYGEAPPALSRRA